MSSSTERSLVLIKPDAVRRGLLGEVLSRFERKGLVIEALVLRSMSPELLAMLCSCRSSATASFSP